MEPIDGLPKLAAPLGDVTTDRLVLRRLAADDLDGLAAVFAKPEVWRFPYDRAFTRQETETFLAGQLAHWDTCAAGLWCIEERATSQIVGYAGLSVPTFLPEVLPTLEVGWRFDPDVWGRGYATEAARAAVHEAFTTLGLEAICSLPQVENLASVRVAERIGMRRDRVATIAANDRRGAVDAAVFMMSRAEWIASA
ncbi:MAG: GNAT family N-acetyltransferase [Acidimicrobiia bacterium]